MASYYSPDLFLEDSDLVVIFLSDGLVTHIPRFDSKGRRHESGDMVEIDRGAFEGGTRSVESAVVLGWGESQDDAIHEARTYYRRLIKWHGEGNSDNLKIEFFGHDLAQSELLNASYKSTSESDSSDYGQPLIPRLKRSRKSAKTEPAMKKRK